MEKMTICDISDKWIVECDCWRCKDTKKDNIESRDTNSNEYYEYEGVRYLVDGPGRVW